MFDMNFKFHYQEETQREALKDDEDRRKRAEEMRKQRAAVSQSNGVQIPTFPFINTYQYHVLMDMICCIHMLNSAANNIFAYIGNWRGE